jgi:putative phage-type endonuclease
MTAPTVSPPREVMPVDAPRDVWLAERRNGIGSSDIPKIAGLSKWGGALQVYFEKTEAYEPEIEGESAEIGLELEPWLAGRGARKLDRQLVPVGTIAHRENNHHRASLDRLTVIDGRPGTSWTDFDGFVELKTALGWMALDWADEGVVPAAYYAQVQWERYVSGLEHAWLVALLGIPVEGEMIKVFDVPNDPEFQEQLVAIADDFWSRVQDHRPPPADGLDGTVDMLKKRWTPEPDQIVELDPREFFPARDRYRQACADAAEADLRKKAAANQIRMQLGAAEAGVIDRDIHATWKPDKRGIRTLRIPEKLRSL